MNKVKSFTKLIEMEIKIVNTVCLIVIVEDFVLLLKRHSTTESEGFCVPSNLKLEHESEENCAIRVLKETTGIEVKSAEHFRTYYSEEEGVFHKMDYYIPDLAEDQSVQTVSVEVSKDFECCLWTPIEDFIDYDIDVHPTTVDVIQDVKEILEGTSDEDEECECTLDDFETSELIEELNNRQRFDQFSQETLKELFDVESLADLLKVEGFMEKYKNIPIADLDQFLKKY